MLPALVSAARSILFPAAASPLRRPPSARWARGSAQPAFLPLEVADVVVESPSTKSIVFADTSLAYRAGQHLTLVVDVDGRSERRCYSFSSFPAPGVRPAITVRRVDGGTVSNFLHDSIRPGAVLRALPPTGTFTLEALPPSASAVAFVAGGVGITPIISMAEALLRTQPATRVLLVYGNRNQQEIVFRRRLTDLAAEFGDRLCLRLAVDAASADWTGVVGPLTGERVLDLSGDFDADAWFVCGPQPMMDGVVAALRQRGVDETRIHLERFQYATAATLPSQPGMLVFGRSGRRVAVAAGTTILEAAERAGVALPSSCRMGGCGACKVKVDGRVVAAEPNCLSPRERADGHALACCSFADGEVSLPDY